MSSVTYPILRRALLEMALKKICRASDLPEDSYPAPSTDPSQVETAVSALLEHIPAEQKTLIGEPELRLMLDTRASIHHRGNHFAHSANWGDLSGVASSYTQDGRALEHIFNLVVGDDIDLT